ncbi:hypothetical protein HKX48_000731 [Thoreauomyces humboldtii]|nr:hypothetical protein HKX48_000731 [Thoreauomyces humboldtii]
MVQSYLTFIVKSTLYSTLIIGSGYLLLKATVPSPEQMALRLKEAGRGNSFTTQDERQRAEDFYKALKENAESDRPIWDVRWAEGARPGPVNSARNN